MRAGDRDRHGQAQAIVRRRDSGIRESRNQAGLHQLCGTGNVTGALLDRHPQPRRCARCGLVQIPPSGRRISTRKVHRAAPLPGGRGQPGEVLLNVDRYLRLAIRHDASITRRYGREPLPAARPQAAHQPFHLRLCFARRPDAKPGLRRSTDPPPAECHRRFAEVVPSGMWSKALRGSPHLSPRAAPDLPWHGQPPRRRRVRMAEDKRFAGPKYPAAQAAA